MNLRKKSITKLRLLIGFISITVLAVALFLSAKFLFKADSVLESLPNPDLTGIEKQVVEKIHTSRLEVEKDPDSAQAWANLAMVLDIHGFKAESIPCYKQALKLSPDRFDWSYYCATALSETGSLEAFEWFKRCQVFRPDYAPLHTVYARALYNAGRFEDATQAFQRALALDENLSVAYLGLGEISVSQNDLQKSLQFLLQAIETGPRHREAHSVLAQVYRRLNKLEDAAKELQIAQSLPKIIPLEDPVYNELIMQGISTFWYRERGLYYQGRGLIEEAIQEHSMALQFKPDPVGYNYIANLAREINRFDEANSYFRTAITLAPNYLTAHVNLVRLLLEIGWIEEAQMWVEKSLRLDPSFPDAYLSIGTFYMETNRNAEAIALFRRGLKLTQGFMPIALRLAWLLSTTPDDGLRNGEEALLLASAVNEKLKSQDAKTLDVLAVAYAETGRFDQAVKAAHKAYKLAASSQQKDLADEIQARLSLFQTNQPYRRQDAVKTF